MLHGYAGAHDRHGNELVVTEIAVADEIAAAADLVKGKLTDIPVAVVRGLTLRRRRIHRTDLLRPGEEDLFWLGTEEAIALGRGQAQLLRRSVRRFSDEPVAPELVEAAVAEALTAPAPHHTRPVRFVWMQDAARRVGLLDRMKEQWRTDLTGDGRPAESVERRGGRGQILYDAPELVIPFMVPDGAHSYPDASTDRRPSTPCSPSRSVPRCRPCWWRWPCEGSAAAGSGRRSSPPTSSATSSTLPADWEPLGAIAIGYPDEALCRRTA